MDLEYPVSSAELYLARGNEVALARPIMQGDVFRGISIPGVDDTEENLAIVVHHPCSMRQGSELAQRLKMARVRTRQKFALKKWAEGYFGLMPLPDLFGDSSQVFHAATLDELGRVPSAELDVSNRIACLSPKGLMLLQQRMVFSDTRVAVDTDTLMARSEPVLEEAELLEEWNEELAGPTTAVDFRERLTTETKAFDDLLSEEQRGEEGDTYSLRSLLKVPSERSYVRKEVRSQAQRRKSARPH